MTIMDPSRNMRVYRETYNGLLAGAGGARSHVPFLALHLKDLLFIHDTRCDILQLFDTISSISCSFCVMCAHFFPAAPLLVVAQSVLSISAACECWLDLSVMSLSPTIITAV